MSEPGLRAASESGEIWNDPSAEQILEILDSIERGDELFLVIERLSDPEGQTYMQTIIEGGSFVVEHRDGSADQHFRAVARSKDEAFAVFTGWASQTPGWRDALAWELEPLDQAVPGS